MDNTIATPQVLAEQLELADALRSGRDRMLEPQDLPERFGCAVRAIDRLLEAVHGAAVVAGGWAVWRHGYVGRVTQDIDIVVPADLVDELLRAAALSGFAVVPRGAGLWPRLQHKESDIQVDLLPEGATPGTPSQPAPAKIPHPSRLGGRVGLLKYIDLPALVELKLGAGRVRDDSDVVELILANPDQLDAIRQHLAGVHKSYVTRFDELRARAQGQTDR